ncbi:PREDICTED: uncharacterized protein LOC106815904 [Priapulus caudatus]|uniref:Uncharacterized protein LOC106815904 n=1 Tax=Priapulus caudatus TaxID=37621 RepID=A0ABM1EUP6_PRICU|nr:PREDICTED: uncharacterized protein LOC106815904 [Priapulus caudatus]
MLSENFVRNNIRTSGDGTSNPAQSNVDGGAAAAAAAAAASDGDVVKRGYLYIKRPPGHSWLPWKVWAKRYFILRELTTLNSAHQGSPHSRSLTFEMYCSLEDQFKRCPRKVAFELQGTLHVCNTRGSSRYKFTFVIVSDGCNPLILAADSELVKQEWLKTFARIISGKRTNNNSNDDGMTVVSEPAYDGMSRFGRTAGRSSEHGSPAASVASAPTVAGSLFSLPVYEGRDCSIRGEEAEEDLCKMYPVRIQPTFTSEQYRLTGDYMLKVTSQGLAVYRPGSDAEVMYWPLKHIRKFKNHEPRTPRHQISIVTLETGRRSPTGDGLIQLSTRYGRDLVREIRSLVYQNALHRRIQWFQDAKVGNLLRHREGMPGNYTTM